ncbi:DNA topoisomerase 2 [Pleodorina starrii]|uniref:DNA topoisomerase 2 n=1 Tax=Pleodorina starrii TaxID=330485 RepID=A0A9W6BLZ1_9CHLO|nr:DNA topoisomerase 2 [Pleodorina starrii]
MVKRELVVVPALYKIFDEVLVNAIDHVTRLVQQHASGADGVVPVRNIRVNIDQGTGQIEVTNDGDGLDAERHPEHGLWVPELVFGHLLTSGNYDDDEERVVGGQNGIGAKACNIFSKWFEICNKLAELIVKRRRSSAIKPQHIKNHLVLFIKCLVPNPTFDSQTKDLLTTPASRFGSKVEIDDKFMERLYKTGLVDRALALSGVTEDKQLRRTDGRKTALVHGITKLDDAVWAGTARSLECTLILTEGDSAKAMALSGLEVVGRERYGVFPLRGKLLNVKDVSARKLAENEEISMLKKILGLESGRDYSVELESCRPWPLRYGRIMIMTDQDTDGSHIKGLLFNLFQTLWPSLFERSGFMCSLLTPIVKVRKGSQELQFYNLTDYENWVAARRGAADYAGWDTKYYKGLATSKDDEARGYFRDMKVVQYVYTAQHNQSTAAIDLAFNKKRADDRKEWLGGYDRQATLKYDTSAGGGGAQNSVPYEEFVHKELIHFSTYDVERSIPSVVDGLKISQRKVLFGCFKRKLTSEVRVAQLAAYVSEHTAYHHGEASLQATIVGMAQDFVGSNNINLLMPNGQFGTRVQGGKNAGSPRYIYTELSKAAFKIFRQEDAPVLKYMEDDGQAVEPEFYAPILPMVLINGALGIGTGFSTNVPCYSPQDVIVALRSCLTVGVDAGSDEDYGLMPWYRGFTGNVFRYNGKWVSKGRWERLVPTGGAGAAGVAVTKVRITELPVGSWTEDYKEMLEQLRVQGIIISYESNYFNDTVDFTVTFPWSSDGRSEMELRQPPLPLPRDDDMAAVPDVGGTLDALLKLVSSKNLGTNNMYLFNSRGQIKKYSGPGEILREFVDVRLDVYIRRKAHQLQQLEATVNLLRQRVRFLSNVISGELAMTQLSKQALEARLEEMEFPRLAETGVLGVPMQNSSSSYNYLLRMPIYNLTPDKKREMEGELTALECQVEELHGLEPREIWLRELDELEQCLNEVEAARLKSRQDIKAGAPTAPTPGKRARRRVVA